MSQQGKALDVSTKHAIVALKSWFDKNKQSLPTSISSTKTVSEVFGFAETTVKRVMAEYRKSGFAFEEIDSTRRGKPSFAVNATHFEAVRQFIRQGNRNGNFLNLQSIADLLKEREPEGSFSIATLARTLERWGFVYGEGRRTSHLKEKDEVIAKRRRYLRRMIANRDPESGTLKPEVYLDETYVNKNHSKDTTWYFEEDGPFVSKPTGKGERLIIVNAITKNGWVPGSKLVFKSSRKTGDYHGQMTGELFEKWFKNHLIPNIPSNSLIVLDNASYHNVLTATSPPTAAT